MLFLSYTHAANFYCNIIFYGTSRTGAYCTVCTVTLDTHFTLQCCYSACTQRSSTSSCLLHTLCSGPTLVKRTVHQSSTSVHSDQHFWIWSLWKQSPPLPSSGQIVKSTVLGHRLFSVGSTCSSYQPSPPSPNIDSNHTLIQFVSLSVHIQRLKLLTPES